MTIDLTAAAVRPAGGDGLASRTAAGFVALGSDDAAELLAFVDAHQTEANLIEQLANRIAEANPRALALLFTAAGDPWLLAWGTAVASIVSPTMRFTVTPVPGEVLVHRLPVGADARVTLSDGALDGDPQTSPINLAEGSMPADAVVIDLTQPTRPAAVPATLPMLTPVDTPPDITPTADGQSEPVPAPVAATAAAPEPAPEASPEPASLESGAAATEPASEVVRPSVAPPVFDVPYSSSPPTGIADDLGDPAEPAATEPVGTDGPSNDGIGQPAAQGIVFADDLEEISDLIDAPRIDAPPIDTPAPLSNDGLTSISLRPAGPEPDLEDVPQIPSVFSSAALEPAPEAVPTPSPTPPPVLQPVATASPTPGAIGPELVLGIGCTNGHHNHPDAAFCTTCGARMGNDDTTVLLNGPRPPLGVLVADDGSIWSIESDLVFGRDPNIDDDVRAGRALPVALEDDTVSMSRRHARLRLDEWHVQLTDLGSSNGTWMRRGGTDAEWVRVTPDAMVNLESGDEIKLGGRTLHVELHHRN